MYRTTYLFAALAAGAPLAAQWKVSQTKDPITDEVATAFMSTSTNAVPNAIGLPSRAMLILRCKGGEFTALYVTTNGYTGDSTRVQYRMDGGSVFDETWIGGVAKDALFYDPPYPGFLWLTALGFTNAKHVAFRWFPPREDSRTATFSTIGFGALPQAALAACGRDRRSMAEKAPLVNDTVFVPLADDSERARQRATAARLESQDSTLPWAGAKIGLTFWRNDRQCAEARFFRTSSLVFFRSEADAKLLGRKRSTETGC
jgi:hypothetical protein